VASEKDRMLRGVPYLAGAAALLEERKRCRLVCERFNATSFGDTAARRAILRELLGDLGDDADVMAPFECDYGYTRLTRPNAGAAPRPRSPSRSAMAHGWPRELSSFPE